LYCWRWSRPGEPAATRSRPAHPPHALSTLTPLQMCNLHDPVNLCLYVPVPCPPTPPLPPVRKSSPRPRLTCPWQLSATAAQVTNSGCVGSQADRRKVHVSGHLEGSCAGGDTLLHLRNSNAQPLHEHEHGQSRRRQGRDEPC
jgi:hypothetical protein